MGFEIGLGGKEPKHEALTDFIQALKDKDKKDQVVT